jgi:hypothetical protein
VIVVRHSLEAGTQLCKGSLHFHARPTSFSVAWLFLLGLASAKWLLSPQLHVKQAGFNGLFETLLRFEIAVLSILFSVPLKDVLVCLFFSYRTQGNER